MYKLPSIPISKIRERFAEVITKVSVRGDRILVERHGKPVAAVISMDDLELLEQLEDKYDAELAETELAKGEKGIPWEVVKKELGL